MSGCQKIRDFFKATIMIGAFAGETAYLRKYACTTKFFVFVKKFLNKLIDKWIVDIRKFN